MVFRKAPHVFMIFKHFICCLCFISRKSFKRHFAKSCNFHFVFEQAGTDPFFIYLSSYVVDIKTYVFITVSCCHMPGQFHLCQMIAFSVKYTVMFTAMIHTVQR